jgi:hypothetical protein
VVGALSYAVRDAAGAALAHVDGDDDLLAEIMARYRITGETLTFVIGPLSIAKYDRDDAFRDRLFDEIALTWAGR